MLPYNNNYDSAALQDSLSWLWHLPLGRSFSMAWATSLRSDLLSLYSEAAQGQNNRSCHRQTQTHYQVWSNHCTPERKLWPNRNILYKTLFHCKITCSKCFPSLFNRYSMCLIILEYSSRLIYVRIDTLSFLFRFCRNWPLALNI